MNFRNYNLSGLGLYYNEILIVELHFFKEWKSKIFLNLSSGTFLKKKTLSLNQSLMKNKLLVAKEANNNNH